MAVVNVNSTSIANASSTPRIVNSANVMRGKLHQSKDVVTVTNGDSIGSIYRLVRVRSADLVGSLALYCSAITGAAANFGLIYPLSASNGGATLTSPNFGSGAGACFAAAQSIATALNGTNITYSVTSLANSTKRVWELLGFASDPGVEYDLIMTLTAAATATGQVLVHLTSTSGD